MKQGSRVFRFTQIAVLLALLLTFSCEQGVQLEVPAAEEPFKAKEEIYAFMLGKKFPERSSRGNRSRFKRMSPELTNVRFRNEFMPDHPRNALYSSGFSCGGVAIGDVDDDGWPDLFFTGGPTTNKLFRNLGNFRFEDVTDKSGISSGGNPWSAGASFADIDADGDLDLYVCNHENRNQLWINDGAGSFSEQAEAFGLGTVSASLMSYFQDFDADGDLDLFVLTNRLFRPGGRPKKPPFRKGKDGRPEMLPEMEKYFSLRQVGPDVFKIDAAGLRDMLFLNENGHFRDIAQEVGIRQRGHGLSAAWWDFDQDGDQDLYVANDHNDPDHLYRNDGGTFTDVAKETFPHVAWFAMGSDVADLDGNGLEDLFTLDMSGTDHFRQKTTMGAMTSRKWFLENANPRQYMRNALLMNEGESKFREAAYLAGLADSDWGWSPKLEDFDEDGRVDAYVTNGMSRNFTHSDFPMDQQQLIGKSEFDHYRHTGFKKDLNLAFRNTEKLRFDNVAEEWGLGHEGMSFAAAHGDLDRDGDLDLVVANLNEEVSLYRNDSSEGNRIVVYLNDKHAMGTKVTVLTAKRRQTKTLRPATGYMSCDEPILHFGLGEEDYVGVIEIEWADGTKQDFGDIHANQFLEIARATDEPTIPLPSPDPVTLFRQVPLTENIRHEETPFDDYKLQPLLPHKLSELGPAMAWADLDKNGRPDLFLGGGAGKESSIWLNHGNGEFRKLVTPALAASKGAEDLGALFFDYNGDGRLDLLVACGSNELPQDSPFYRDRLYKNVGGARFEQAPFPSEESSSGPMAAADFDRDGDVDLFIGGRQIPSKYPLPGKSSLYRNNGGRFVDVTASIAPNLSEIGMVTGCLWSDATGDGWPDLLLTTEWGSVKLFRNDKGKLVNDTQKAGLANLTGWWTGIAGADFDNDGDMDYALGNLGLNTKYKVSPERPFEGYYGSFGETGRKCFVEATWEHGKLFPVRGRSCSSDAMPFVSRKFPTYEAFARATIPEIYSPNRLKSSHRVEAKVLESGLILNDGTGKFSFKPFPRIAQISPSFGIVAEDFDKDGNTDLVLAQNFFSPQLETGKMAGGLSQYLRGKGDGTFTPLPPSESGISVKGDCRSLAALDLDSDGVTDLAFARNNKSPVIYLGNKNETERPTLRIRLQGINGNPTAIGSTIFLHFKDGSMRRAETYAGSGYLTQTPPVVHFGLGKSSPGAIRINWPNGRTSTTQISKGSNDLILSQPEQ